MRPLVLAEMPIKPMYAHFYSLFAHLVNLLAIKYSKNSKSQLLKTTPGFLSVFLWKGAQWRHIMMPKMRSVDTIGIDTKAALALKKHFS